MTTKKTPQHSPVFTVGGSFQALTIDHLTSDSSSDEQDPKTTNSNTQHLPSPQSHKPPKTKQRAKDRARKLNQLTIPPATTNEDKTVENDQQIHSTPQESIKSLSKSKTNSAKKNLQNTLSHHHQQQQQQQQPIKSSSSPTQQENKSQDFIIKSTNTVDLPCETQLEDLNPTVITSPTISTVNSIPTSTSTTDLEDDDQEESIEVNHLHQQSGLNGIKNQPKIYTTQLDDRSPDQSKPLTKQDPNVSYPDSPATARPFPVHSASNHRLTPKGSIHSPKSIASNHDPQISQFGADHTPGKKWQTVLTRVIWSLVMVTGFITLMALGHLYLIILVFIIQLLVFREVTNLFQVGYKASAKEQAKKQLLQQQAEYIHSSSPSPVSHVHHLGVKEKKRIKDVGDKNRSNKIMSWYFFGVANYFLYGESIIYYFKHITYIDDWYLIQFGRHHRFISLLLYLIGFLGFVTNLDRGHLRRQFGLFSWIHMSLLLIIVFGQFMVNNILEGLIWFWVPASLVIMNDVAAYVFGMLFGKHQLIKLSPKKTVEGFVGGFFMTVIFGVLWGSLFMGWNYMICPVKELGMTAFSEVKCEANPVFKWRSIQLNTVMAGLEINPIIRPIIDKIFNNRLIPNQLWWTPFQLHCLVLATFAGLVAPFGGFFASGFKRAFNVKDFGHTIPGHGGLTDRFDCQFIMGVFTYFYYSSLVKEDDNLNSLNKLNFSIDSIFEIIKNNLNDDQQIDLFFKLKNFLGSKALSIPT